MNKIYKVPKVFIIPCMSILAILTLYPFFYGIVISFTEFSKGETLFVGFSNYKDLFLDPRFWNSLKITVLYTTGAVIIELIIALLIASFLNDIRKGSNFIRNLILLPMGMVPIVVAIIFRYFIYSMDYGLANFILTKLHIPQIAWLGTENMALLSVILIDVWQWTPFMILIIFAGLQTLPVEPYEAAKIDGATEWQEFIFVTLPGIKRTLLIVILFRIIDSVKVFDTIIGTTGGGPGISTQSLNLYIYVSMFRFQKTGYASAMAVIFLIIVIIIANFLIRRLED